MRRSETEEDDYCQSEYYSEDRPQSLWTSYTGMAHPQNIAPSNFQGSTSRSSVPVGYHGGQWPMNPAQPNFYNNHDGPYGRQGQDPYALQQQMSGYNPNPGLSHREHEQWPATSVPSGSHGRYSMEPPSPDTPTSQENWHPHHSHSRSISYAPHASSSHYQGPSSPPLGPEIHNYIALPSTPQSTVESYLAPVKPPPSSTSTSTSTPKRAYQCTWPGCQKAARGEIFKSKDNARVHVHKHFGSEKLFECVVRSCRKKFASEDAAKRHRDTTESKAFSCAVCNKEFARKDYRDVHQRRCQE